MPGEFSVRAPLRGITQIPPRVDDHRAAARLAASVAVPSLVLALTGHQSWTIYAIFGAFTAMYGRREPHTLRLLHQSRAAVILIGGVGVGSLASFYRVDSYGLVALQAVLACLGSLYSDKVGLKPSGPFWGIFAVGACAMVPISASSEIWQAVVVSSGSAVFALGVGMIGRVRARGVVVPETRTSTMSISNALAYPIAVGVAGSISTALGIGHSVWAMAAAAVPLAVTELAERVSRGVHRVLGTLLGLLVSGAVLLPFGVPTGVAAVLLIIVLQFATELYMTRNYGLALVFFTPLVLLVLLLAHPADSATLIVDRAVQTTIGATTGLAVACAAHGLRRSRPRSRPR